jgi:molybdenum cofactor cytidylyltransferase
MSSDRQQISALGVVLLAAGASSRMGRPKLLLPWVNTTILGYLLEQWRKLGASQIAVVCSEADAAVSAELDRLEAVDVRRILNPRPDEGMFSSVRCAAQWTGWLPELTHWIITLGDQPHIRLGTLRTLLEFGAAHREKICQPARNGCARHPVLLPGALFGRLREATETHLKQFLLNRAEHRALCEMADPGLDFDLDRPEDYERALKLNANTEVL